MRIKKFNESEIESEFFNYVRNVFANLIDEYPGSKISKWLGRDDFAIIYIAYKKLPSSNIYSDISNTENLLNIEKNIKDCLSLLAINNECYHSIRKESVDESNHRMIVYVTNHNSYVDKNFYVKVRSTNETS